MLKKGYYGYIVNTMVKTINRIEPFKVSQHKTYREICDGDGA